MDAFLSIKQQMPTDEAQQSLFEHRMHVMDAVHTDTIQRMGIVQASCSQQP